MTGGEGIFLIIYSIGIISNLHYAKVLIFLFQRHKINCDRSNGIIEMVMEKFTIDNEGTYTVQIQDGKAKNQSSLVLIGDGMFTETLKY